MESKKDEQKGAQTLSDDEIFASRPVGRRSTIAMIGATLATVTGVMAVAPEEAEAQRCTDSDGGRFADPVGRGRRCRRRRSCTDSDGGRYADPVGRGRRCFRRRRCTDSDGGRYADPVGRGRRC